VRLGLRPARLTWGAAIGMMAGALMAASLVQGDAPGGRSTQDMATGPRPPAAERPGSFRVECSLVRQARIDPIQAPGQPSHHLHHLFGNTSLAPESTYVSMLTGGTSCTAPGDTAGYWSPALVAPDGTIVRPDRAVIYYRNRPAGRVATTPFPRDFRMIAGGADAFPNAYWTCDGEKDTAKETRRSYVPDCGAGGSVKLHVFFPACWDGAGLDAPDHRSHLAYGLGEDGRPDGTHPVACPRSHPVEIPQLDYRVVYPARGGAGYRLSDGQMIPHADFWNTWQQRELEALVQRCLWKGVNCRLVGYS
jgi:hypothetical protein